MSPTVILHQPATDTWLQFNHPQQVITTQQASDVTQALASVETAVNQGLHAAGFISYEAAPAFDSALVCQSDQSNFPLLWFGLYDPAHIQELDALPTPEQSYQLSDWQPSISQAEFEAAIAQIKAYIASGDTFQVNYTFRLRANFTGNPWALFLALMQLQPGNYSAFLDIGDFAICSASPELFFTRAGETFTAKPMKGTTERGWWLEGDRAQATALQASAKNQAENLMIVDMLRNDLGRIAKTGTVQVPSLFDLERYPTLWQMTSTVQAQSAATMAEAMAALFPCASITGAPKARTMEIIQELECSPRRIYCGAIGHWSAVSPNTPPQAQFNVAIRTVLIDKAKGEAEYGVGSGIVWDSDATAEYGECCLKTAILNHDRPSFDLLETMLWEQGKGYFLLDYHLKRMGEAAEYFGYPFNHAQTRQELQSRVLSEGQGKTIDSDLKVRLLIDTKGHRTIQVFPWENHPQIQPLKVCLHHHPIDIHSPFLYHKTTHRSLYNDAKAAHPDMDDVILWNGQGEVCEACIANLVLEWQGELLTPPVASGLLPGTFRAWLLDQGKIREQVITVEMLKQADKLYLINSVRKWSDATLVSPKS